MTFKSGVEKISFAVLENFKNFDAADIKKAGHMKQYMDFIEAKVEHPELTKQELCELLRIPYASIGRLEDEFNIGSAYMYEGGTKSKPSNKSKNTKITEETIDNNDTSININDPKINIPDSVPQIKQSASKCYLCNKSYKGKLGLNTHFRMKHPTLSVDKDNINPKNIESLSAGKKSIPQVNPQSTRILPTTSSTSSKSVSINQPA